MFCVLTSEFQYLFFSHQNMKHIVLRHPKYTILFLPRTFIKCIKTEKKLNLLAHSFSSTSSTYFDPTPENLESSDGCHTNEPFAQMGSQDSAHMGVFTIPKGVCNNHQNSNLCSFDGIEESSEEEEDDDDDNNGSGSDEDNFPGLDSLVKRRDVQVEVGSRRVELELEEHEFRHPLVRETCRLISLRSEWNPKFEYELRRLLRSLKPRLVCAVLRFFDDERVALMFFHWADRQWRYRHDFIVYYTMLEVLSKTKLCQGARRVLRLMARRRVVMRPEDFGYVMVSYSRAGKLRNALKVLTLMQKAGIEPNLSVCNTAIYVLIKGNKFNKALRFIDRMKLIGIMPNVVTYNCLIKGYCDLRRVEDAIELIGEMPEKGCSPDKVSYYTVIGYFCTGKRVKEVRELLDKMEKESGLLLDQVTYNNVIHVLSKHGHAEEALEFLREAEERGFRVDKVGYSAIIVSFCKKGKIDIAKGLVNEMTSKGSLPDVVTYTAVVDGFCRIGKIDQAKKLIRHMYKHGCKPNTVTYTALLNGLCHNGSSLEAREMLNTSEEEWWTPNAITYSAVMHGLRREGKLSEACDLVREMVKKGFFPNPVEINLLIQSLCQGGKTNEAKTFMQDCLNRGCAVNVVNFTTVIHGFCKNDELEAAISLLDDMYLSNKHPDVFTYTAVVDALGKKGRIEEATALILKMLHKGLLPTPVTFRTVIHRYCEMGSVEDLLILLDRMLSRQECRTAYNQVIEKLCFFGKLDEAYKLLGKVLRTASKLDANTCHVLMEAYMSKRNPLSAYKVACRMFNRNLIPDLKLCEKLCKRLMSEGRSKEADELMLRFVERGRIQPRSQEQLKCS